MAGQIFSIVILLVPSLVWGQVATSSKASMSCYTCGLEDIDPEYDVVGSYGDIRKEGTPTGKKMYNHTCDIADELGVDDKWLRKCPPEVKSCFMAEGRYEKQTPLFRGCAEAQYAFAPGCNRELQAVQIVQGRRSVDVEILLCFCNEEACNIQISGSPGLPKLPIITITVITFLITTYF